MIGIQSLSHGTGLSSSRTRNVQSRCVRSIFNILYAFSMNIFSSIFISLLISISLSFLVSLSHTHSLSHAHTLLLEITHTLLSHALTNTHSHSLSLNINRMGLPHALGCDRGRWGRGRSHEECYRHRITPSWWIRWHRTCLSDWRSWVRVGSLCYTNQVCVREREWDCVCV